MRDVTNQLIPPVAPAGPPAGTASRLVGRGPWLPGRPGSPAARAGLVAVNLAAVVFFALLFPWHGLGSGPYRIDLDVYRIGSQVWLHEGNLYGQLPATASGMRLPFSYPPVAAVLLAPLSVVPVPVAGAALTVGTIALTALVLRVFLRSAAVFPGSAAGARAGSWWTVCWLLPGALFLEPVRNTLDYGQVNVALMALVAMDCLAARGRWPRGVLVGIAAAVKLTPGAFVLFFLLRRDWRAAGGAVAGFAASTGLGFLLAPGDSARYWTSVFFQAGRPGSPSYAANQSIQGVLARAGLDPHTAAGAAAWLALSAVVLALACRGMRRALDCSADALALSLNAFAALLISPISWSHHWVWGEPALLVLAIAGARRGRGGLVLAGCGLALFAAAPQWWFPSGGNRELSWAVWQQALGSGYVLFAVAVLSLAAWGGRLRWLNTRYIVDSPSVGLGLQHGFRRVQWLRVTRCGSATPSAKQRQLNCENTSRAVGSTRRSLTSG
jgi:alpha-1,2-mannosyltransferase